MAKKSDTEKNAEGNESGYSILDGARKILLAGVGAVNLAQEEVEDFVNKLIERGEIAEKDGRKLVTDIFEKRKKQVKKVEKDAEKQFDSRIEDILSRLNIPTKSDIEALNDKIAQLTDKIDALKKG